MRRWTRAVAKLIAITLLSAAIAHSQTRANWQQIHCYGHFTCLTVGQVTIIGYPHPNGNIQVTRTTLLGMWYRFGVQSGVPAIRCADGKMWGDSPLTPCIYTVLNMQQVQAFGCLNGNQKEGTQC